MQRTCKEIFGHKSDECIDSLHKNRPKCQMENWCKTTQWWRDGKFEKSEKKDATRSINSLCHFSVIYSFVHSECDAFVWNQRDVMKMSMLKSSSYGTEFTRIRNGWIRKINDFLHDAIYFGVIVSLTLSLCVSVCCVRIKLNQNVKYATRARASAHTFSHSTGKYYAEKLFPFRVCNILTIYNRQRKLS